MVLTLQRAHSILSEEKLWLIKNNPIYVHTYHINAFACYNVGWELFTKLVDLHILIFKVVSHYLEVDKTFQVMVQSTIACFEIQPWSISNMRGHGGRVVITLSPPTSEAGV